MKSISQFIACLALLCGPYLLAGQDTAYEMEWIRNFGKAGEDEGKRVIPASNGDIWMVGYTQQLSNMKANAWIIKINAEGQLIWDVAYGGKHWDEARAAVATPTGELVVAGVATSKNRNKSDIWLFKLDSEGEMLWSRTYEQQGWDEAFALIQLRDGGFAIAGSKEEKGREDDLWLIRTDSLGAKQWEFSWGGQKWEGAHDLLELPDGQIIVAGHAASEGLGQDDGWILSISPKGQMNWNKHYGGPQRDALHSLLMPNDSTLLVAGFTKSKGGGQSDMWLLNIDLEGQMRWERTMGGKNFEKARGMILTPDGNLLFGGYTHSKGIGNGDAWAIATTPEGDILWENTYGGKGFDKIFHLAAMPDGSVVLIGTIDLGGQFNLLAIKLKPKAQ